MNTAISVEARISHVAVTDEAITACLVDGRVISDHHRIPPAGWLRQCERLARLGDRHPQRQGLKPAGH